MNSLRIRSSLCGLLGTLALFSHPTFAAPVKPQISVSNAIVTEGNSGTVAAAFTVTLSAATTVPVNVAYATSNATAVAPNDYNTLGNTLTFAPGETSKTVNVAVKGDTIDEVNETFNFNLSNPTNATINDGLGIGSITDDDDPPAVSVNSAAISEGNTGTKVLNFTVRLSAASSRPVSVSAKTVAATATATTDAAIAGTDFVALPATTINFAPGELVKTVGVTINGDTLDEADETFNLLLSAPGNATLGTATGTGTISDDDTAPTIAVNDVTVTEGDTGAQNATFTVSLSAASGRTVKVTANSADSSAIAGADYNALPASILTFLPGQTSKAITVAVRGDLISEATETFQLKLTTPINATISDSTGIGSILDNDPLPSISVAAPSVSEGNSGETALPFVLKLSTPSSRAITVKVQSSAAATDPATAGVDYTVVPLTTVTIPAGVTQQAFNVMVKGDTTDEIDEKVALNLAVPVYATLATTKVEGTIIDDDAGPKLTIQGGSVSEGQSGTKTLDFTVSLSEPSSKTITASFKTANGSTDPAIAGTDYVAVPATTLSFAPGETSKTVSVTINGDTLYEASEKINGLLSLPVNASIAQAIGMATIENDDTAPVVSITPETRNFSIVEGNSGTKTVTIKVQLSAVSSLPVTIETIVNGSATEGEDYSVTSPTPIVIPAGQTSKTFNIVINGDTKVEPNEVVFVALNSAVGATIDESYDPTYGNARYSSIIIVTEANEDLPTLSVGDFQYISEGDSGSKTLLIPVTLSKAVDYPVMLDYHTVALSGSGAAIENEDYVPVAQATLTFAPGETNSNAEVTIIGDTDIDFDKQFHVAFSNPVGAYTTPTDGMLARAVIVDDDYTPRVFVTNTDEYGHKLAVIEGNSGSTVLNFTIRLSNPSGKTVTVKYKTGKSPIDHSNVYESYPDGYVWYATEGDDYVGVTEAVATFAPGETTKTVSVTINGDTAPELDEDFGLFLSDPVNSVIDMTIDPNTNTYYYPSTGIGTIRDNDGFQDSYIPVSAAPSYTMPEGQALEKTIKIPISIPAPRSVPTKVWYKTVDGTATQGDDFRTVTSSIILEPGETTKDIEILLYGDRRIEDDESFTLMYSSAASFFPNGFSTSTTITLTNDDLVRYVSISPESREIQVAEGDSGTKTISVKFKLSIPSSDETFEVPYYSYNGNAMADEDYVGQYGVVTFAPGETEKTVNFTIKGDTIPESDESFTVQLADVPPGVTYDPDYRSSYSVITITNDDASSASSSAVSGGNS